MCANVNSGVGAVDNGSDLLYVGFPSMVGSSMRMGNSLTESYALPANFTLCHFLYLQIAPKRQDFESVFFGFIIRLFRGFGRIFRLVYLFFGFSGGFFFFRGYDFFGLRIAAGRTGRVRAVAGNRVVAFACLQNVDNQNQHRKNNGNDRGDSG